MDEYPQPGQAFMSALVTEHFVLQSARSTAASRAVGRSGVYLTCVTSSLVAFWSAQAGPLRPEANQRCGLQGLRSA